MKSRVAVAREVLDYLNNIKNYWGGTQADEMILGFWADPNQLNCGFEFDFRDREHIYLIGTINLPSEIVITDLEVCGRKLSYTASLNSAILILQNFLDTYETP